RRHTRFSRDWSSDVCSSDLIKAYQEGLIQDELVEHPKCSRDEHLREDIKLEELSKLKPTFSEKGVVTAGSASGIVDGAASLLIRSEERRVGKECRSRWWAEH